MNVQASWNINQYQQNRTIKTYQDPTYSPPTSQLSQSLSGKTPATPKGSRARPASQANTTGSNLRLPRLSRAFLGINATSSAMSQLSVSCKKSKGHLKRALYVHVNNKLFIVCTYRTYHVMSYHVILYIINIKTHNIDVDIKNLIV